MMEIVCIMQYGDSSMPSSLRTIATRSYTATATQVQIQYEESTCTRYVGANHELVPEDSSLGHPDITGNSFNNNELCGIVRVLNATLV